MPLQYPLILDQLNSPFIYIRCYKWKHLGKRTLNVSGKVDFKRAIFLPMSRSGITESRNMDWSAAEMANLKTVKDFGIKTAMEWGKGLIDSFVPNASGVISHNTGALLNDFSAINFSGNNFRELSLNWDFMPSSPREAEAVNDIIEFFQTYSLPNYNGNFIDYPCFWTVEAKLPNNKSIFQYTRCIITDVTTEAFKDENLSVYTDGNTNRSLSISFREIVRIGRGGNS